MKRLLIAGLLLVVSTTTWAQVEIQSWHTENGTKVMYVHAPQLPMLDIQVTFDAGSVREGDEWGLASFTSALVGTTTSQLDENQVSEAFNNLGAQVGSDSSRDNASLSLRTLTRPEILESALQTFEAILSDSQFDQAIFDRELQRLLIGIKQKSVKPQTIASEALWKELYGDHPYAHPTSGTVETVKKLTPAKLKAFYKKYYVAQNAMIAIVGNVDKAKAQAIVEQLTANLPKGEKPADLVKPTKINAGKVTKTEFDSTQTYYYLTQQGIERGHEDYVPLFVGNHLFGGNGFGSMLMQEVREKRGLVYSVYSYFAPMKVAGPYIIGLSTKNASAYEAEKVVQQTLKDFMAGFSGEELQAIKDNLVGGFPLRLDSNSKILGYLSMIGFYNLPLDYLDEFPKAIEAVTKEEILKAWNQHIEPEKMLTIMVGKPE
ncbi:MAG: pitrilysin family protein [Pseudomonadota bacterium]|nr:pitrilysin family protein [Pseudomonadota bacterium]